MLGPDVASVIAIWKDPAAPAPLSSGMLDYTVLRVDGSWRIAVMREAFLQPVPAAAPAAAPATAGEWRSMFDGKTSKGWVSLTGDAQIPSGWRVEGGCLITDPSGKRAGIRTAESFQNFEMTFEWMVSAKGNSGVKYRLYGLDVFVDGEPHDASGFEYQVADDHGDPGAIADPKQRSGGLYGVTPIRESLAKPVGEWNSSRLVVAPDHVEHWLNGTQAVRYDIDVPFASPIVLQHHNTVVRFRNLRVRPQ
jgi:hypothetical protein